MATGSPAWVSTGGSSTASGNGVETCPAAPNNSWSAGGTAGSTIAAAGSIHAGGAFDPFVATIAIVSSAKGIGCTWSTGATRGATAQMPKTGAFIAGGTATDGAMEVLRGPATGSAAGPAGIQRWHIAGGISASSLGRGSSSALNSAACICGGAAEASAAAKPGIPRLHAARFASSSGSCSTSAVKRSVCWAYSGVGAAEGCTKAATGSAAGMGTQWSHTGIVCGARSKHGVGSSSAAKRRMCGLASRGASAVEARTKAATGSGAGGGIQLWHRAGTCDARSGNSVGSSWLAKRRTCGASAGSNSVEARTKAATGSGAGARIHLSHWAGARDIGSANGMGSSSAVKPGTCSASAGAASGSQRSLCRGDSTGSHSQTATAALMAWLVSRVSGQWLPVRMRPRTAGVCQEISVQPRLPGCKGISSRKPATPLGAGSGEAISCTALSSRSRYRRRCSSQQNSLSRSSRNAPITLPQYEQDTV